MRSLGRFVPLLALALAACAPTTDTGSSVGSASCASSDRPVVAVVEFENTTGQYGTTVTGVEEAATARIITLLKATGCYEVIERSELQNVMMQQGLESMAPEALAKAAGTVVVSETGRGTASNPNVSFDRIPGGDISYSDRNVGPLLAQASQAAIEQVVGFLRAKF